MPNGRPGDHPLTDMLSHGGHPFPAEIETLLREIFALDPDFPDGPRPYQEQVEWQKSFFRWAGGVDVPEGIAALRSVLAALENGEEDGV